MAGRRDAQTPPRRPGDGSSRRPRQFKPIEWPPETRAAAVSMLRRQLQAEEAELEAQLKVVKRLLDSVLVPGSKR